MTGTLSAMWQGGGYVPCISVPRGDALPLSCGQAVEVMTSAGWTPTRLELVGDCWRWVGVGPCEAGQTVRLP